MDNPPEQMPPISRTERIFNILRQDLLEVDSTYHNEDVILCPICLRKITRKQAVEGGPEHIIPKNVLKDDPTEIKRDFILDKRSGITMLCRQERVVAGECSKTKISLDGCNGFKGKRYDRLFKRMFDFDEHKREEITNTHKVAMLVMAYLAAFQTYGYRYAMDPKLADVRLQFDYPNEKKTQWVDQTTYYLYKNKKQIITSIHGFAFSITPIGSNKLSITFKRCRVFLPAPPKIKTENTLEKPIFQSCKLDDKNS